MGRRTPRTAQQKLRGFKKRYEGDYEKWKAQFITRGEVDEILQAYFGQYHEQQVVPVQDLVGELARRAGIGAVREDEPTPETPDADV